MKRKQLFSVFLISLCLPAYSHAQAWSGIVDPKRAIDWSGAGVTGGPPTRNTICSTLSDGATVSQINSALSNCPSGQVVMLNAGNYSLSGTIYLKSNVTLRGSGATSTVLTFS